MSAMIDEKELKDLVKAALAEALEEQRALVKEIVEEAIEEIALTRAIDEGLQSAPAKREEVFAIRSDLELEETQGSGKLLSDSSGELSNRHRL